MSVINSEQRIPCPENYLVRMGCCPLDVLVVGAILVDHEESLESELVEDLAELGDVEKSMVFQ